MLDINFIREHPEIVKKNLEKRKDPEKIAWLQDLIEKDKIWRDLKQEIDHLRHQRNTLTQAITIKKKAQQDATQEIRQAQELPKKIQKKEQEVQVLQEKIEFYMQRLPNLTHESVPYGKDESENVEIKKWGKIKKQKFELKSHSEIAERLQGANFEKSAKIAGNGFYFLTGDLALLNQALIRFAIDHLVKKGYLYTEPPLMMRKECYAGVTDLGAFNDVLYKIEGEDLYLIATSEHPLVAQFANEILEEEQLPIKLVGYSMCFRKEVGSTGVDTKGLFRTHQFNKVEQVIICDPKESWKLHEELLKNTKELFKALEVPYRVVNICTGDLGIVAAKKYDIEVWMPRQEKYKEVASCSNCTEYQARRLNMKVGKRGGEKHFVHTPNNTAIATSRALVAILENHQQKDGSIKIPKALQKYMNKKKVIQPWTKKKNKK